MKRIFLIDDNLYNQQEQYGCTYLTNGAYASILELVYAIRLPDFNDLMPRIQSAPAILIHDTFLDRDAKGKIKDGSISIRNKIVDITEYDKIPLVLFSNSKQDVKLLPTDDNAIRLEINKQRFYSHLRDFLEFYQASGEIEFRILMHGEDFLTVEAMRLRDRLLNHAAGYEGNELMMLSQGTDDLDKLFKLAGRHGEWKEFVNNPHLTVCDFRAMIRELYERIQDHG